MMAGPGIGARVVPDQVRIVDVMPTILDLLGVEIPADVQGSTLRPALEGQRQDLLAYSESWYPRYHYGWSELVAVRDGQYKFILAPRRELYDVQKDPGELTNLAATDPSRADALERALRALLARVARADASTGPQPVAPDVEQKLRALGYVGGSTSAKNLEDRPRRDPKDAIELYNLLKLAGSDSEAGRLRRGRRQSPQGAVGGPRDRRGAHATGQHLRQGRPPSRRDSGLSSRAGPRPRAQHVDVQPGVGLQVARPLRRRAAGFERARQLDPRSGRSHFQIGDIPMQRGEHAKAVAVLTDGLSLDVDRPPFLVKLAEAHLELKQLDEAEQRLKEAVSLKPDVPRGQYDLALVYEQRGQGPQARAAYEAEVAENPRNYGAQFNLGKMLLKDGHPADAATRFRGAIDAQPEFAEAYLYLGKALLDAGNLSGRRAGGATGPGQEAAAQRGAAGTLRPGGRLQPDGARERSGPSRRTRPGPGARPVTGSATTRRLAAVALAVGVSRLWPRPTPVPQRQPRTASRHRHHRHAAGRSSRRLRQHHGADTTFRPPRARRRARPRRHDARASHTPGACIALHRPLSRRTRRARQHLVAARPRTCPTLAEVLSAQGFTTAAFVSSFVLVEAVGPRPRIRPLRRQLRDRRGRHAGPRSSTPVQRRGDDTVAEVERGSTSGRRMQGPRARRSGCTSTTLTTPTSRRSPSRPGSPTVPTTARSRGPTRCSAGCGLRSRRVSSGTTHWSSSRPTTARRSASTTKPGTASLPTRPRCEVPFVDARARDCRRTARSPAPCALSTWRQPCWPCWGCQPPRGRRHRPQPGGHLAPGAPPLTHTTYAESLTPLTALPVERPARAARRARGSTSWRRGRSCTTWRPIRRGPDLASAQPATARALRAALEALLRSRARTCAPHRHPAPAAVGRGAAEARRARLREPGRRQGLGRPGRRPEGQDRRVPAPERTDARGSHAAARRNASPRVPRSSPNCRRPAPTASRCTSTWDGRSPGWDACGTPSATSSGRSRPCRTSRRPISSWPMRDWRVRTLRGAIARASRGQRDGARTSRSSSIARARCGSRSATRHARWRPTERVATWRRRTRWSGGAWASCCSTSGQPERGAGALPAGRDARSERRRLLELARHGARRRRPERRGREGVPRSGDAKSEERAVRLQPGARAPARRHPEARTMFDRALPSTRDSRPRKDRLAELRDEGTAPEGPVRRIRIRRDGPTRPWPSWRASSSSQPPHGRSGRCSSNGLVNWDDPDVFTDNANLSQRGRALAAWAFTTRHMGHYQPLVVAGLGLPRQHAARRRARFTPPPGAPRAECRSACSGAAACSRVQMPRTATAPPGAGPPSLRRLLFALHPLRVEPVAWASAVPYLLSHALLLAVVRKLDRLVQTRTTGVALGGRRPIRARRSSHA